MPRTAGTTRYFLVLKSSIGIVGVKPGKMGGLCSTPIIVTCKTHDGLKTYHRLKRLLSLSVVCIRSEHVLPQCERTVAVNFVVSVNYTNHAQSIVVGNLN